MKKIAIALAAGICAGILSIPLAVFPGHLVPMDREFNRRLPMAWFLGNALQGIVAAFFLAVAFQAISRHFPRAVPALVPVAAVAVLGVFIPCPGIIDGSYADSLVRVYALVVGISVVVAGLAWQRGGGGAA